MPRHMALHSLSMNASALSLVTSAELPRLELLQMPRGAALNAEDSAAGSVQDAGRV